MIGTPTIDWTEANQQFLGAELARLKAQLSGADTTAAEARVAEARAALPFPGAIDRLADAFGLSAFERDLLLLCAGVEMDAELAAHCATAQGVPGRGYATFGLALAALADQHWSACAPVRPLRLWRLLELKDEQALATGRLSIDERVLHYLAGVNYLDPRLRPLLRPHVAPTAMAASHAGIVETAVQALTQSEGAAPAVQLIGDDAADQKDIACVAARRLGYRRCGSAKQPCSTVRCCSIATKMQEPQSARAWRRGWAASCSLPRASRCDSIALSCASPWTSPMLPSRSAYGAKHLARSRRA
jgi:hypothetical protein